MIRLLALLAFLWSSLALAQTCPTRPVGNNTNACASTAFVQQEIGSAASVQTLLDLLTTTRGSIIERGASNWQGIAPGTSGYVFTSNGAGADPSYLPRSTVILQNQEADGVDGGTCTSGSWQTRTLNTEVLDADNLITLASNEFTSTVNGIVEWRAPAYQVDNHQTRLFNVTDTAVTAYGTTEISSATDNTATHSFGVSAVVAGKAYRIEHQCQTTNADDGFGLGAMFGGVEVYTQVTFRAGP